jgi:hypothetical protein
VQNPLTTLPEAIALTEPAPARQGGPAMLVGHSFSGMIVTEAVQRSPMVELVIPQSISEVINFFLP